MDDNVFSFMHKFLKNNYNLLFPEKEGYVIPVSDIFFLEPKACDEARVPIIKLSQSSDDCYYIFFYIIMIHIIQLLIWISIKN